MADDRMDGSESRHDLSPPQPVSASHVGESDHRGGAGTRAKRGPVSRRDDDRWNASAALPFRPVRTGRHQWSNRMAGGITISSGGWDPQQRCGVSRRAESAVLHPAGAHAAVLEPDDVLWISHSRRWMGAAPSCDSRPSSRCRPPRWPWTTRASRTGRTDILVPACFISTGIRLCIRATVVWEPDTIRMRKCSDRVRQVRGRNVREVGSRVRGAIDPGRCVACAHGGGSARTSHPPEAARHGRCLSDRSGDLRR